MDLIDTIRQSVLQNAASPAFIYGNSAITYEQFYSLLGAVARTVHEQGVRRDDVLGLSMGQIPLHCVAILALGALGAVSVPVHPELPLALRSRIVEKYGIRTIISIDDHGIAGVNSIRLDTLETSSNKPARDFTDYWPDPATPLRISLTSGTTGEAKGDVLTHSQLLDRVERTIYGCDISSDSRVMPPDINSAMGLSLAIGVLKTGGTLVFPGSYLPQDRITGIKSHAVTHAFFSQWAISQTLALLSDADAIAFPTLRHLRVVGSRPSQGLILAIRTKVSPNVFVSYGLTELGPISMATPDILRDWPASSGRLLPWVHADVLDEAGQVLPPDVSGEIRLKVAGGPTGYYRDAGETARKFRNGWFYTGDRGRITEEGLLFIEGRIDEMINLGGYKIDPAYVEDVLAGHPLVAEAAVFTFNDESGVPLLAAAVVPRTSEIDMDQVARFARQQLRWAHPKRFFILAGLPRTPNGKLIRTEVAAIALKSRNNGQA